MTRDALRRRLDALRPAGRRGRLVLCVLAAFLFVSVASAGVALAYWETIGQPRTATAVADQLTVGSTPAAPTAHTTPDANSGAVALTFAQAVTGSGVPVGPDHYRVERYSTADPPVEAVVPVTCTVASSTVSCTDFAPANGHWQYTVTPTYGDHWLGTESAPSAAILVDTAAPVVAVTYPVAPIPPAVSTRYGPNWDGAITGTVADSWDNVVSAQVQIQDTTDGVWWNGTGWVDTQAWVTPTLTPGSPSTWSYPFSVANLTDTHQYSVTARATDYVGNVGHSSANVFDVDIIDPLPVSIAYPIDTGVYGANWSGTMAGTAGDPSGDLASVVLTIKDTTANLYWAGPTAHPTWQTDPITVAASSRTQWSYALAADDLTNLHDYTLTATATDAVDNSGSETHHFSYRTGDVSTTVTYPTTETTYGTNWDGNLSGTAGAGEGRTVTRVDLTVRDTTADLYWTGLGWQAGSATISPLGTDTWTTPLPYEQLTAGHTYSLQATATDDLKNTHASSAVTWTYLVTAPTVAVSTPTAGVYGTNWSGTITGTAAAHPTTSPAPGSDLALAGSATVSVEDATTGLYYNGSTFASASHVELAATGSSSWSFGLDSSKLTSGHTYSVHAHAVDTAGNVGVSPVVEFAYLTTAPSGLISYPVDSTTYGGNWAGELDGTASAASTLQVANVELSYEDTTGTPAWWTGSAWTTDGQAWFAASGTTSWTYAVTGAAAPTSTHTYALTVRITDSALNVTTTSPVTWTYDLRTPTTTVEYPTASMVYSASSWFGSLCGTATAVATGTSVPPQGTVVSMRDVTTGLWWDGTAFGASAATWVPTVVPSLGSPCDTATWSAALPAGVMSNDHDYTVSAHSTDAAGNVGSESAAVTFTYDNVAPTAAITFPADGVTYGTTSWANLIQGTANTSTDTYVDHATLTIRDTTAGTYWSGSDWQGDPATVTDTPPTHSSNWVGTYPFPTANLTSGHTYAVSAVVYAHSGASTPVAPVTWHYTTVGTTASIGYPLSSTVYGANWGGVLSGTASATSGLTVTRVNVTISDTTTTTRYFNGTTWQDAPISLLASGTTEWSYPFELVRQTNGHSYSVVATASDSGGNTPTPSLATTWTVDTSQPTVTVAYPVNATRYGPNWTGSITGSATDSGGNLSAVSLQLQDATSGRWWNGTTWQGTLAWVPASGTGTWSYPIALSKFTDAHAYLVVASGMDAVGNVGTATSAFTMDITSSLPVAVTYPVNNAVYAANWSGTLAGTAGDPSGDLAGVALTVKDTTDGTYWNGSSWQSGATTRPATGTSTWTYGLTVDALTSGHGYTVTAVAADAVGNTGTTTSAFGYATGGGSTAVTYPVTSTSYGANWSGTITGTASPTSGQTVSRVNVTVKNTTAGTWWNGLSWQGATTSVIATGTTTWSMPLGAIQLTNGSSYTVDVASLDTGSVTTNATQVSFTYRSTGPTVVVTYPAATTYGASWSGTITGTSAAAAASGLSLSGPTLLAVQDATTGRWFTGSAFTATSQTWLTATGNSPWSYALASTYLTTGHTYTVVGRASDNAGNTTTTSSTTFGYDATPPAASVSYPVTATGYGGNWSGVLAGAASAHTGLSVAKVELTVADTTNVGNTLWWNGSAWVSGAPKVTATGTGAWNYSLAASALTSQHAYSVVATTTDSAGNTAASAAVTWTYDGRGPVSTVTYPTNGAGYGLNWLDALSGSASATAAGASIPSGGTSIAVANTSQGSWFDGSSFAAGTQTWLATSGSTSWTYALANELLTSGDAYTVLARTTDSLGNQTTTSLVTFVYDLSAPTATVTAPSNAVTYGANWSGSLSGTATGGGVLGVTGVVLTVQDITGSALWFNGSTWQGTATTVAAGLGSPGGATSSWSYALAPGKLATGHTYSVTATATNQGSATGDSSTVAWGYNTVAPTPATTYPVNAATYGTGWTGTLTGTASAGTGLAVSSVSLTVHDTTGNTYWNGSAWAAGSTSVTATGGASWGYALPLAALTNGHSYSLVPTATDSGGNTGNGSPVTWSLDTTPPTAAVAYPVSGTTYGPNWTGAVTGTATDTGGALSLVRVQVQDTTAAQWWNGTGWQSGSTSVVASGLASWTMPLSVNRLTDTHHYTVTAVSYDNAGNPGTSTPATFVADLDSPLPVAVSYPLANGVYGANWSGTITGTASDASGNLSTVRLTIRDTTAGTYWSGSGWQGGNVTVTPTGTTSWTYALATAQLTNAHAYSVSVTATDALGNTGVTTTAFSYQTSGVTTAVTYPVTSTTYGANWSGTITGTAAAPSGRTVTKVDVTVTNTAGTTWWNGSSWQGTSTSVRATGTTTWSLALAAANLSSSNGYIVDAVATDDLSNTTTAAAVSFTYQTTAPTVAVTYPVATTYGSSWSGTVSGTAAAASGLSLAGSTSLTVQDTTTGKWFTGSTFSATTQTWLTATGSTSWTYALAASTLTSGDAYTVIARATDTGGNTTTTSTTAFTYFVAAKLVVTTSPTTTVANATMTPAVTVAIEDAAGHIATTDNASQISLAIGTNPGSSTLTGGGAVTVVGGVATYNGLSLNKAGTGYTLTATSSGLTSATSSTFNVVIGAAAKVAFTTQPSSSAASNTTFATQPVVTVQDAYGNTVTTSTALVTLTSSGGTLACTATTVSAVSGVATFSGCKITGSGTFTLTAASSALTSATSNSITVSGSQVAAPTNVVASASGSTAGRTRVSFTSPSPTTGISGYTCSVYVNAGAPASTPTIGAFITSRSCTSSGTTVTVGSQYSGTNKIVVIVTANPLAGYTAASSSPVVGSVR